MPQKSETNGMKITLYVAALVTWLISLAVSQSQSYSSLITQYDISEVSARALLFVISLPVLIVYFAIAFAFIRFYTYAVRIKKSDEGPGYNSLAMALLVSLVSLFLSSLLSNLRIQMFGTEDRQTHIVDYVSLYSQIGLALATFYLLHQGSKQLLQSLGSKARTGLGLRSAIGFSLLSATFVYAVFQNPIRTASGDPSVRATYGVNDVLILITVILPYLISWLLGISAYFNLRSYAKKVSGIIYKQIIGTFAAGMGIIIFLTIGLQFLTQISESFRNSGLSVILSIVSFILIAIVVGYLKVAQAAKKLDAIETL